MVLLPMGLDNHLRKKNIWNPNKKMVLEEDFLVNYGTFFVVHVYFGGVY